MLAPESQRPGCEGLDITWPRQLSPASFSTSSGVCAACSDKNMFSSARVGRITRFMRVSGTKSSINTSLLHVLRYHKSKLMPMSHTYYLGLLKASSQIQVCPYPPEYLLFSFCVLFSPKTEFALLAVFACMAVSTQVQADFLRCNPSGQVCRAGPSYSGSIYRHTAQPQRKHTSMDAVIRLLVKMRSGINAMNSFSYSRHTEIMLIIL